MWWVGRLWPKACLSSNNRSWFRVQIAPRTRPKNSAKFRPLACDYKRATFSRNQLDLAGYVGYCRLILTSPLPRLTSANINKTPHHDSCDHPWDKEQKSLFFFVNKVTWLINVMNDHAIPQDLSIKLSPPPQPPSGVPLVGHSGWKPHI